MSSSGLANLEESRERFCNSIPIDSHRSRGWLIQILALFGSTCPLFYT